MKLLSVFAVLLAVATTSGNPTDLGGSTNVVGCNVTATTNYVKKSFRPIIGIVGGLNEKIECALEGPSEALIKLIGQLVGAIEVARQKTVKTLSSLGTADTDNISAALPNTFVHINEILFEVKKMVSKNVSGQDFDDYTLIDAIGNSSVKLGESLTKIMKTVKIVLKTFKQDTDAVKDILNALLCLLHNAFAIVYGVLCTVEKLLQKIAGIDIKNLTKVTVALANGFDNIGPMFKDILKCRPGALDKVAPCLSEVISILTTNSNSSVLGSVIGLVGGLLRGSGDLLGHINLNINNDFLNV